MRLVSLGLVGLMMTGVVGVGSAVAYHRLLFPFVIAASPNVTTFVTVMNPFFGDLDPSDPANLLHYQYHHKSSTAAADAACDSYSTFGHTSTNDVLTYDVSGFLSTEPLLGDTTSDSFGGTGLNLTVNNQIGYLVVIQQAKGKGPNQPTWGEAHILDFANGGLWGYSAVSIPENDNGGSIGGAAALLTGTRRPVHLLPQSVATTDFIVTPLGTTMSTSSTNRTALKFTQTGKGIGTVYDVEGSPPPGGVYGRNEELLDFERVGKVRCVGILTYSDLISASVLANPVFASRGGWGWLTNIVVAAVGDPVVGTPAFNRNAIVQKRVRSNVFTPFVVDAQLVPWGCGGEDECPDPEDD
jgi:hypothetical protein